MAEGAAGDAPGPRPEPGGLPERHRPRLLLGDDGRLARGRRQVDRLATTTTSTSRRKVVDMAHARGVTVEGELGCLGSLETMRGDKEDGHGTEADDDPRAAPHRPGAGRRLRQEDPARRARHRHRHQPRRLQVHPQAHRRHPGDRPHQGDPPPHPEHPPGDARLLERAAGPAGRDPQVRRRAEGDLRRAGRGDPGGDQARRAQDQHRHRHPPGDDRGDPQVHGREPGEVRPARLPQAGARGGQADLPRALPAVRLRRPGGEDRGPAAGARSPSATPRASWRRRSSDGGRRRAGRRRSRSSKARSARCRCWRAARCARTTRSATTAC